MDKKQLLSLIDHVQNVLQTQVTQLTETDIADGQISVPTKYTKDDPIETILDNGMCEFWFFEKDGQLRFAIGTRNVNLIKEYSSWVWRGPSPSPSILPYFDIQRNEWRSFIRTKFIKCTEFTPKEDLYED